MTELEDTPVVTCFLRSRGEVLLLRRSGRVGSYRGRWGGVAGYAEGDPDAAARREIAEETGLGEAVDLVASGEPFAVEDRELGKRWIVHPYLFDCASRDLRLDWESVEAAWVPPTEILRRETVPRLWTSYERVAPTLESVAGDRQHGSAWLSLRALEVLRDRAGWLESREGGDRETAWEELRRLARRLVAARPAMAALSNRVHRAMHEAAAGGGARALEGAAHRGIVRALAADEEAAHRAGLLAAGRRVLTLSRSGTVTAALLGARPRPAVWVAASRPPGEGVAVAEELARAGLEVTLLPDAALAYVVAEAGIEVVLTGADTVLPDGAVVNKTGTHLAALAATAAGVPFYAATASDKVAGESEPPGEVGDAAAVYAGEVPLRVENPLFEVTPADRVTGVVSERGVLRPDEVGVIAEELRELARW